MNDSIDLSPLIDISNGKAEYVRKLKLFEPGYNLSDEACTIDAETDWDAVILFINEYSESPNTLRSYALTLERFILWLVYKQKIPMSAMKRNHVIEYNEFIQNPEPLDQWCGPKIRKILADGSPNHNWKPFSGEIDKVTNKVISGGVSGNSAKLSRKILESLFNYLVDANFFYGNPLTARKTKSQRSRKQKKSTQRFLEINEISIVINFIDQMIRASKPVSDEQFFHWVRAKYIFLLYFHTGMRISEPVEYTMGDFDKKGQDWSIFVQGKGDYDDEGRPIDLGGEFMEALKEFRLQLGLSSLPMFEEKTPIIPRRNLKDHIVERRISDIFRNIFDGAALSLEMQAELKPIESDERSQLLRMAGKLKQASCHWLRHSHATYYLQVTKDLKSTQERLGHQDVSTTMIYLHTTEERSKTNKEKFNMKEIINTSNTSTDPQEDKTQ